ncbi:MAG: hypothetical protein AB8G99_25290 [Planctomycetaceae bacterium]
MSSRGFIDTAARSVPGEYARMLLMPVSIVVFLIAIAGPQDEVAKGWLVLLCVGVVLRGLGPIGSGLSNHLITSGVVGALVLTLIGSGTSVVTAGLLAMLALLTLKVLTEFVRDQNA